MLLILALTDAAPASARLKVSPSLILREEYNDNFFLEEGGEEEEDEFITTVSPYLSALLETKSINLDLTYGFEFRFYRHHSEFDETQPSDAQRALLEADLFPDRDFTVNVLDRFTRVVVDERRPSIEENAVVNRTNFNRFRVNPLYRYRRWPTFTGTLSYEYENRDYDVEEGSDSDRHVGGMELEKRLSKRLSVYTGYEHTTYRSDTAADYRRDDLYAGFVHRPGPKLKLSAKAGAANVDRTEDSETTERLFSLKADYSQTAEIHFLLGYDETLYDSVSFGLVRGQAATASLVHRRRFPTVATLTVNKDDYLDTDRKDFSIGAAFQTSVHLRHGISLRSNPYVTWYEFKPEEDHVLRYGIGISVQKEFKCGYLRLGYDHHASENDKLFNDYRNNIVFLEASAFWGGASDRARQIQGSTDPEIPDPGIPGREYRQPKYGY